MRLLNRLNRIPQFPHFRYLFRHPTLNSPPLSAPLFFSHSRHSLKPALSQPLYPAATALPCRNHPTFLGQTLTRSLGLDLDLRKLSIPRIRLPVASCSPVMSPPLEICDRPSATPKRNELAGLPVELLLSITDLLPVDDTICLSLCNRRLLTIYHHRYHLIRPSSKEKLPLLYRLERDLPHYFACDLCFVLHKYDPSDFSGLSAPNDYRVRCLDHLSIEMNDLQLCREYLSPSYERKRFYWLHLHLAMQRFHLGDLFGISTASLSFTQVRITPTCSPYPEMTSLFSIDAQICPEPPGLCVRTQHMMLAHESTPGLLVPHYSYWETPYGAPQVTFICSHLKNQQYPSLLDLMIKGVNEGGNPFYNFTCFQCNTDGRIEFRKVDSQLALVITAWINLGPGLTPYDPKWKIHTYGYQNPDGHQDMPIGPSDCTDSPRAFLRMRRLCHSAHCWKKTLPASTSRTSDTGRL